MRLFRGLFYVMSDGDPSLEEDVPKPLLKQEENVFTPKIATPLYTGGVKLHHKRSDAGETESFLTDAQRNELAFQQLFQDGAGAGAFHEVFFFNWFGCLNGCHGLTK